MQPKQANRFVMTDNRKPSGGPSGNSADSPNGIQLGQLAAMIQAATRIVIFTGAGISTESGIAASAAMTVYEEAFYVVGVVGVAAGIALLLVTPVLNRWLKS